MTTNNSINQASEILVVGPIGTAQDSGVLLTVRKDQAANTAISLINQTDNAATQGFFQLKVQQHNSGTPFTSTVGLGIYNDQAASNVYAGYAVLQNDLGGGTGTKGLVLYNADTTNVVKVGIGSPASAVDQAIWTTTGGQYRGYNGNTAPAAGYVGEVVEAKVTTGTPVNLTNNTIANVTSVALTAGNWLITGICGFQTSGVVATNPQFIASIATTNSSLATEGDTSFQTGQVPINGVNDIYIVVPAVHVLLSGNATYYMNCRGSATTFTATCSAYGRLTAVRIG